jgi:hypothetical protein
MGTFVSVEGSDEKSDCDDCPAGTYAPKKGSTKCIPSDLGFFVFSVGESDQTSCAIGT